MRYLRIVLALAAVLNTVTPATIVCAQLDIGSARRASAAQQAIILSVQQGISSLPPTSGQSFLYHYNPDLGVFERSELLGTVSFRSPETIGKNNASIRVAGSYFAVSDTLGPIDYEVQSGGSSQFTRLGTTIKTHVGLLNIGFNYGILDRLEAFINFPVVFDDVQASEVRTVNRAGDIAAAGTQDDLARAFDSGIFKYQSTKLSDLTSFNDGTHVGLGRISIGGKYLILASAPVDLAFSLEFFAPSPSESQFAGSYSAALLPRVIFAAPIPNPIVAPLRIHSDVGYDYDFSTDELRRFVWDVGLSVPAMSGLTFDAGLGGSLFNSGIEWTPSRFIPSAGTTLIARGDNTLPTNFIDVITGFKVRVAENTVLSGAVNIPIVGTELRPVAVGTGSVEVFF